MKPLTQTFNQDLYPFYLAISWARYFVVSYNTNSNSLSAALRGSAGDSGPLFLPFFRFLYLAVCSAVAVAYNKVKVQLPAIRQSDERG